MQRYIGTRGTIFVVAGRLSPTENRTSEVNCWRERGEIDREIG